MVRTINTSEGVSSYAHTTKTMSIPIKGDAVRKTGKLFLPHYIILNSELFVENLNTKY